MISSVETPLGPGRLTTHAAAQPVLALLLSHGAGAGVDTIDLEALAAALPAAGITVHLFEQPWKVAGRRLAGPPSTLDVGFTHAARALELTTPLVVGGRSAGARSAARTATDLGARGLLALAFPLHPPGKPERSRLHELSEAGVPTLVVQGERDAFGRPEEFPAGTTIAAIPGGDHSFKVARSAGLGRDQVAERIVDAAREWLLDLAEQ